VRGSKRSPVPRQGEARNPVRGSKMKYFVYILYSQSIDKYYIGHTNNLDRRLYEHNIGKEKFTRKGIPWILKFSLAFDSNLLANREELRLKKCKNRNYIEQYIKVNLVEHPDM